MKFFLKIFFASIALTTTLFAKEYPQSNPISSIPQPPQSKRWIVNQVFSDEFNTSKLDTTKWFSFHPNWIGREPGLFEPKNVNLKDGYMVLKGEKMAKDTTINGYGRRLTYNISCAAVVSKSQKAHYGYYECRFKANKTTLSTTFWLSSRGWEGTYSTEGRQPEGSPKGKFSQELDICECIGREGDFSGKYFSKGMHSNVHYWFSPENSKEKLDIRASEAKFAREDGKKPSEGFNTYGCWWRDGQNATFFLNNGRGKDVVFKGKPNGNWKGKELEFKFTEPMGLNMVVETYPTPWIALPNDKELADSTKNRSYYDWVRAYILVDCNNENKGAAAMTMFDDHIHFGSKPTKISLKKREIEVTFQYTAPENRTIYLELYNSRGKKTQSKKIEGYSGYGNINSTLGVKKDGKYRIIALLKDKDNNTLEADSFEFEAVNLR